MISNILGSSFIIFDYCNNFPSISPLQLSSVFSIRQKQQKLMRCQGYITASPSELSFAYSQITSISDIQINRPETIKKLIITHCKLQSLKGIQQYSSIQSLNLKFNCLEDAQEVFRIPNRANVRELNLQGNPIEYFAACTYLALRKNGFTSLILFNNKDYSKWDRIHRQKAPTFKQINSKLNQVQQSMTKTLKRTLKNNIMEKYKLAYITEHEDDQTSRENSKQYIQSLHHQMSSNERTPLREVSLSNINMVKSVKPYQDSPHEKSKIPQLIIETIQFGAQNQMSHLPLTQPTATFASQKQKLNMPFKGRNVNSEVNTVSEADQNFTEDEDMYELSYCSNINHQSFSRVKPLYNTNKSVLQEVMDCVKENQFKMAEAFHMRSLLEKSLKGMMPCNMPRRVSYV